MYQANRNKRSKSRDSVAKFLNNISISNMDSVRTQVGMMSMFASQTDELSRYSLVDKNKFHFFNKEQFSLSGTPWENRWKQKNRFSIFLFFFHFYGSLNLPKKA